MTFDQRGLPGVSVVTTEFRDAVTVQSRALGFEPAVVYVPHPVQNRTADELAAVADAVLDSAKLTVVAQQAGVAHVRIDYLLKGQPQQVVVKMRTVDGHWYPAAMPQLARPVAPPDWDNWWGPPRAHVHYITTGRAADPSPVQ